tara:strand:- start:49199 stop:49792 length:594 start_codon:yes stop_codon:yes gene_type:complete
MNKDTEYRLAELERQAANLLRIGTIAAVDYAGATASVRIGDIETASRPWLTQRAGADRSWWAPEVGEQVMLLSPTGDLSQGIILPAIYTTAAPAPASSADVSRHVYGDGLVIEHDRAAKLTRINALDSEGTLVFEAKNIVIRTGENGFYHLDHAGLATRITHGGGAAYTQDSWQLGAVITPNPDQGHSPPEVLTPEE